VDVYIMVLLIVIFVVFAVCWTPFMVTKAEDRRIPEMTNFASLSFGIVLYLNGKTMAIYLSKAMAPISKQVERPLNINMTEK
jgi:hypothetical protein